MSKVKEPTIFSGQDTYKARSPSAREAQLIALAYDLAEERLRNGTATSQEVTHFLKMGSTKDELEKQLMETQIELLEAKKESMQVAKRIESLYANAIQAVRSYRSPSTTGELNSGEEYE